MHKNKKTTANSPKPKRFLGQNWLTNSKILELVASSAELKPKDIVLEIGPGTGLLTEYLAQSGAQIIAVEKDRRLVSFLSNKFKNQKNVKIIEGDILKFALSKHSLKENGYKAVGNIPYYLTSYLLKTIFEKWPRPEFILFTVQKEVALRMTAQPPKMNLLALSVQTYAKVKILKYISKNSFRPAPKVDSALVKITPSSETPFSKTFLKNLFKIARAAFGGKRKQLANSLSDNLKISKESVLAMLERAGIDKTRRPESLNINEWLNLTKVLFTEH